MPRGNERWWLDDAQRKNHSNLLSHEFVQHSFADSTNEVLWAIFATIASFLIGGCVSVAMAIRELELRHTVTPGIAAWVVLVPGCHDARVAPAAPRLTADEIKARRRRSTGRMPTCPPTR